MAQENYRNRYVLTDCTVTVMQTCKPQHNLRAEPESIFKAHIYRKFDLNSKFKGKKKIRREIEPQSDPIFLIT